MEKPEAASPVSVVCSPLRGYCIPVQRLSKVPTGTTRCEPLNAAPPLVVAAALASC